MTGLRRVSSHVYCSGNPWILYMQIHTSLSFCFRLCLPEWRTCDWVTEQRPREGCLHTCTIQEFHGYYTCKYTLLLIPALKSYVINSIYRSGIHMTRLETQRDVCLHMYTVKESKDTRKHPSLDSCIRVICFRLYLPEWKTYDWDTGMHSGRDCKVTCSSLSHV